MTACSSVNRFQLAGIREGNSRFLWAFSAGTFNKILHMRFLAVMFALFMTVPAHAGGSAERGKYLAVLGDCAGCHTAPLGAAFAGGLPFHSTFGTVYSTNITPDQGTGIGGWTEEQFYRALHDGIAPGGRHLYPALPYAYFTRITRRDTADLFAYLKTLRPVDAPPTPNKLTFPFNIRRGLAFWNALYLDKSPPKIPAGATAQWKRGEYLVNGLGHCAACHTPKTILFGDIRSNALTGGVVGHWYSANLTGGDIDGLGRWSQAELAQYLATGRNKYATAAGTMQEKVTSSTSRMTGADRAAIAAYFKSLPARPHAQSAAPDSRQMASGQVVFVQHCQVCHQPPGKPDQTAGGLPPYPRLAGDTLVLGHDPTTVLHIILGGAESPVTANERTTFSMPAFPTLSDQQIADVATYIRNSWGNHAAPATKDAVTHLRAHIQS